MQFAASCKSKVSNTVFFLNVAFIYVYFLIALRTHGKSVFKNSNPQMFKGHSIFILKKYSKYTPLT